MIALSAILNFVAWIAIGYVLGNYFGKYVKDGTRLPIVVGVIGAITGGFFTILAYGLPGTFLWANNFLFAMIGSLGMVYTTMPEKARSVRLEQIACNFKKLNKWYIDFAGMKR